MLVFSASFNKICSLFTLHRMLMHVCHSNTFAQNAYLCLHRMFMHVCIDVNISTLQKKCPITSMSTYQLNTYYMITCIMNDYV